MSDQSNIKNQESNYSPNGDEVIGVVDAVKTFKDLGLDPDNREGMRVIEVDSSGDVYYRTDGGIPTSASRVMEAGRWEIGKAEALAIKFLNVGAAVTFVMQAQNFNRIKS